LGAAGKRERERIVVAPLTNILEISKLSLEILITAFYRILPS
jgi:hypothetical protein